MTERTRYIKSHLYKFDHHSNGLYLGNL